MSAGLCVDRTRGIRCRKSVGHIIHAVHKPDCRIPVDEHHRFVPSGLRKSGSDGTMGGDPWVLTSVILRRSDLTYLKTKYESLAKPLRVWIAADRGIKGVRLERHLTRGDVGNVAFGPDGSFASLRPKEEIELIHDVVGPIGPVPDRTPMGTAQQLGEPPIDRDLLPLDPDNPPQLDAAAAAFLQRQIASAGSAASQFLADSPAIIERYLATTGEGGDAPTWSKTGFFGSAPDELIGAYLNASGPPPPPDPEPSETLADDLDLLERLGREEP